jgi:uncharacterized glyoxalase superfamily protein PhnB
MTDPLSAPRQPETPVDPDPAFAARLRARLERALRLPRGVQTMTTTTEPAAQDPGGPAPGRRGGAHAHPVPRRAGRSAGAGLVRRGVRRARLRGDPVVVPDGRIGHSESVIGDSVLKLSEEFPESDVLGPQSRGGSTSTLVLAVPDVDHTVERAVAAGARLERPPRDEPYGRTGVIHDPFGHRWVVQAPPAAGDPAEPAELS